VCLDVPLFYGGEVAQAAFEDHLAKILLVCLLGIERSRPSSLYAIPYRYGFLPVYIYADDLIVRVPYPSPRLLVRRRINRDVLNPVTSSYH
jgi:hypothetical protein